MKKIFFFLCLIVLSFSCSEDDSSSEQEQEQNPNAPLISILPITEIAGDFAKTGAELIENNGFPITRKGICYSTEPNPTVADFITEEGDGTSGFESELLEVDFETTYYVRAYAENSEGVGYSEELSFTSNGICKQNFVNFKYVTNQIGIDQIASSGICGYGTLWIDEEDSDSDFITDLSPLANIRHIGSFRIEKTHELTSLAGLTSLDSISSISIRFNDKLNNISDLQNVRSLTSVSLVRNPQLVNLSGIGGQEDFAELSILSMPITNLGTLPALANSLEDVFIEGNDNLVSLNGLSISRISGELRIVDNVVLSDFCALTPLIQGGGFTAEYFVIANAFNPTLQDIIDGNCSQ